MSVKSSVMDSAKFLNSPDCESGEACFLLRLTLPMNPMMDSCFPEGQYFRKKIAAELHSGLASDYCPHLSRFVRFAIWKPVMSRKYAASTIIASER